jgi:hypothetical protein
MTLLDLPCGEVQKVCSTNEKKCLPENTCSLHFNLHTMDVLKDIWGFFRVRKKFWLIPALFVLVLAGFLIVFGGSSALAPFIYTVF